MLCRVLVFGLIAAALAGCSEAFDPFVETEDGFALYGFLDARRDTQFVRVQPLTDRDAVPTLGETGLTSADLETGEARAWQDSLVTLNDGSVGLLFFARFRPEPGVVYRLDAEGPNGAMQTVDVPMPAEPALTLPPPVSIGGIVTQRLNLESATRPLGVEIVYTVRRTGGEARDVIVTNTAEPVAGGGYDVRVRLTGDALFVRGMLGASADEPVELLGLGLRYAIVDEDRAVVANGLGVIGVAAAFEAEWTLATEFVEAVGFLDRQDGG